ncbi:MAG: phospho-N-acetylmuramoyl-pentapeptide-transferase [Clostridiales bacterium]|nr:phospho-N-acetylmuramoyl-pentapeptide-transferase [Clostridiales bacterium]
MLFNFASLKIIAVICAVCSVALCAALLKIFGKFLPKDHGREFAVNGALSAGKIRGAGLIFVSSFIVSCLLFVPVSLEYIFYYILLFAGMLSGYLDDRSDKPWNEYKKGAIDLGIAALTSLVFVYYNKNMLSLGFFGRELVLPPWLFFIIALAVVWLLINAVNITDGIDGFCTVLTSIPLVTAAFIIMKSGTDKKAVAIVAVMIFTLLPYLWFNCEPSSMLMGDAGSRALGLLLSIAVFKTGNVLLLFPMCAVTLVDGLISVVKVSLIRFLHVNPLKNIRTPLHDHSRKNKGRSNTQVIFRYSIIQLAGCLITLAVLFL